MKFTLRELPAHNTFLIFGSDELNQIGNIMLTGDLCRVNWNNNKTSVDFPSLELAKDYLREKDEEV